MVLKLTRHHIVDPSGSRFLQAALLVGGSLGEDGEGQASSEKSLLHFRPAGEIYN